MKATPKKLTIYIPHLYRGGAERVIANLISELYHRGVDIRVINLRLPSRTLKAFKGIKPFQTPAEIETTRLPATRSIFAIPYLWRYFRRERPEIFFSTVDHISIGAIIAHRLAGRPGKLFVSSHSDHLPERVKHKGIYSRVISALIRMLYPYADGVIAISQEAAQTFVKDFKLNQSKVHMIYNPILSGSESQHKAEMALHPWLASPEIPTIIGMGRLTPQKNFALLIRAFYQVRKHKEARLIIFGEGERRAEIESLVHQLDLDDCVALPGFTHAPIEAMKQANVLALSSDYEVLPTVLIEALTTGVNIVATDCAGGIKEALQNQTSGIIVPPRNEKALATALIQALEFKRQDPDPDSWRPYLISEACDNYEKVLFQSEA